MPPAHKNTARAERRRQRRQRRASQQAPSRGSDTPKIAPLQLDPRRTGAAAAANSGVPTAQLEPDTEYAIVRRDLWRLTIFSLISFVLMIAVLFVLNL